MITETTLYLRVYNVDIVDNRTGTLLKDTIVLDKTVLQAAQHVGESSDNIIKRIYNRAGYTVVDIGKPVKQSKSINLLELLQS